jgi:hypothetical protein
MNAHRDPKRTQPAKAEDFLLRVVAGDVEDERRASTQRMFDMLRAVAKPGKPKRRKREVRK